eukprot:gnl/TRDRNA2_/TRDRNA2_164255_c0_seq2.p1 gnl/TRDRNA2_/TRDRNA2_164255_c0~~gnl/TRDRNA2_/TRDRNA2_164255_c0_seq2.p1  ORF type:complete len:499 (-),score=102.42 gnl/TRDRNA2_/TRDRNA2_164255_c0_seq2:221-1501(-)
MEAAMWAEENDIVMVNTFLVQRRDALFFPNSLLAEGRNVLLAACAFEEFHRGHRFSYYVLMDDDALSKPAWDISLPLFKAFLQEWEPAVGLPGYGYDNPPEGNPPPRSVFNFDHIFVAVHKDAISKLLPYDANFDRTCAWVSQWVFTVIASALFRNHVLMLPSVYINNPRHAKYPRDNCLQQMANASTIIREYVPKESRSCIPEPMHAGVYMPDDDGNGNAPGGGGNVRASNYLPWGTAKKMNSGSEAVNYSVATLTEVTSCDAEPTVKALSRPSYAAWCRGCTFVESFTLLQMMVASNIYSIHNWNELGIWITAISEDYLMTGTAFAIAWRLSLLKGYEVTPMMIRNMREIKAFASEADVEIDIETMFVQEKADWLGEMVLRALHLDGKDNFFIISPKHLQEFVHFLITGKPLDGNLQFPAEPRK